MKMKVRSLVKPVIITGKPIFGFGQSQLVLNKPAPSMRNTWVYWARHQLLTINPNHVVCCRAQNLAISDGNRTYAHVLEHLLPLKTFGFIGAAIQSTTCLPFDLTCADFINAAIEGSREDEVDMPVATVTRTCVGGYEKQRGGRVAYTHIKPRTDGKLVLQVQIAYQGLGELRKEYTFPDNALLMRIAQTHSQGWPRRRYWQSWLADKLGIWKHHDNVAWPQLLKGRTLETFLDHRCLDLLGALGTLMNGQWLSSTVVSVCSGHEADMIACREAHKNIIRV